MLNALFVHPRIYLGACGQTTHALLVQDGVVRAHGERAIALHAHSPIISPQAACLFPALADAHIHLWGLGQRLGMLDLRGATSAQHVAQLLAAHDPQASPSGWIQGHGWDDHRFEGEGLSRALLDRHHPDVPVVLYRVDHHAAVVNSEALRRAGLDARSEPVGGGRMERDARGELTGVLVDAAIGCVTRHIPGESDAERAQVLKQNAKMLRELGITSAHMALTSVQGARHARALRRAGALTLRICCMVDAQDERLEELLLEGPWRDEQCSVACVKFFADGAMGSRGALMCESYRDGTRGLEVVSAQQLRERIPRLMSKGWQVAVHAIGDLGARHVLDAFEAASPQARALTRPRHEHAQLVKPEDRARYAPLGVLASVQPIHLYSDAAWAHEVLHPEQLEDLFHWRAFEGALAAGSDFPIEDANPWHGISTFMTRAHRGGERFGPGKALSRAQALGAYTTGAAHAAHWERQLGRLDVGMCADVVALDHDVMRADAGQIWGMQVLGCWAGFDEG